MQPLGANPSWGPPPAELSRLRSISSAVQVLLVGTMLVGIGNLFVTTQQLTLLQRLADDFDSVSFAEADRSDQLVLTLSLTYSGIFIITGVVFIVWFYRVRKNAGIWSPATQRRSQGWSIGGWICPVVNFWFPYQIAQDGIAVARPYGGKPNDGQGILQAWWALWVVQVVVAVVERNQSRQAMTIQQLIDSVYTDLLGTIVLLPAAVLAILVVRKITDLHERRLDWELGAGRAQQVGGFGSPG